MSQTSRTSPTGPATARRRGVLALSLAFLALAGGWAAWRVGSSAHAPRTPQEHEAPALAASPVDSVEGDSERQVRAVAIGAGAGSHAASLEPKRCVIRGRVVDDQLSPVAGALVQIRPAYGEAWSPGEPLPLRQVGEQALPALETRTADDGRFVFVCDAPTCTTQYLRVTGSPLHTRLQLSFGLEHGSHAPPLAAGVNELGTLLAVRGQTVVGEVRTDLGAPVAGARVWSDDSSHSARTGSDGSFILQGLPAGDVHVGVQASGFAERGCRVFARRAEATVCPPFVLTQTMSVEGTLVDDSGAAVEGARVWVTADPFLSRPGATSDEEGRFRVDVVPGKRQHLLVSATAHHEGWGGSDEPSALIAEDGRPLHIVLRRFPEMEFEVVDALHRASVADVEIVTVRATLGETLHSAPAMDGMTKLPAAGVARLPAEPGKSVVCVRAPGYASRRVTVTENAPGSGRQTITLASGARLLARVVHEGLPVASARVELLRDSLRSDRRPTPELQVGAAASHTDLGLFEAPRRLRFSEPDGGVEFAGLAAGTYALRVVTKEGLQCEARGLAVTEAGVTEAGELVLERSCTLSGELIVSKGSSPCGHRLIVLDREWAEVRTQAITDPTGRFHVSGLRPGDYKLAWARPDEPSYGSWHAAPRRQQAFTLLPGGATTLTVDTRAFERCTVRVRVQRHGRAVSGAWVTLISPSGYASEPYSTVLPRTDSEGWSAGLVDAGFEFVAWAGTDGAGFKARGSPRLARAGEREELDVALSGAQLAIEFPEGYELPAYGQLTLNLFDGAELRVLDTAYTADVPLFMEGDTLWNSRVLELGEYPAGEFKAHVSVRSNPPRAYSSSFGVDIGEPHEVTIQIREGERAVIRMP